MFKLIIDIFKKLKPAAHLFVTHDSGGRNKTTIVLLHGIAATSKTFDSLINELDTSRYRVIAIDLLGFGRSPKPRNIDYDVHDHTKSIKRTIRKLRVRKPFILTGHSMGSIISTHYCNLYPNEIKELYLLSLPLYVKNNYIKQSIISKKQTDIFLKIYEYLSNKKDIAMASSSAIKKLFRVKDGMEITEENWNSFRLSLKNTIINQDTYNEIKNITAPIHIFYGLLDGFLVMDNLDMLQSQKNVSVTKIKSTHHEINHKFAIEVAKHINK